MNKTKEEIGKAKIDIVEKLTEKQESAVKALQKLAFTDVDDKEVREDFYHPKSAHALAHIGDELVGWAGVHETEQKYAGERIKLGGYGICTHPDWQRRGIASKISQKALNYLKERGCEVGFLSVDLANKASIKLHQKHGFVMLKRKFTWTNSKSETKSSKGGMIVPINSQRLFEYVLNGKEALHIGNGYW